MAQTYALKYLTQAALSAPRDMFNAYVAKHRPIYPTVLIFQCTFVCDARCEMCSNWQRGDRKTDMSLEDIDRVFSSTLWKNIDATRRNDARDGFRAETRNSQQVRPRRPVQVDGKPGAEVGSGDGVEVAPPSHRADPG